LRRALAVALFGALALGCSDQACIQWSAADGVCPSQNDAKSFMVTDCGQIQSVDSEGSFDKNLCCYAVTKRTSSSFRCSFSE
jgi:hypothetical protein